MDASSFKSNFIFINFQYFDKKYFNNDDQLKYVIEYLVLDKGYFMDSDRARKIVFKHPKESTTYTFDLNELSCEVKDKILIGTLD